MKFIICLISPLLFFSAASNAAVQFKLTFEGATWNDTSDWSTQPTYRHKSGNSYNTFGEALRGETQYYFDNYIAAALDYKDDHVINITLRQDNATAAFGYASGGSTYTVNGISEGNIWHQLAGEGAVTKHGAHFEASIAYNLDYSATGLYGGWGSLSRTALLGNVAGGLTRHEVMHVLGMQSEILDQQRFGYDPRTDPGANIASMYDTKLVDKNGNALLNYDAGMGGWLTNNYELNDNWSDSNSGVRFKGIADDGSDLFLTVDSEANSIDFDHLTVSYNTSEHRDNTYDLIERDRAILRGLGYSVVGSTTVPEPSSLLLIGLGCFPLFFRKRK